MESYIYTCSARKCPYQWRLCMEPALTLLVKSDKKENLIEISLDGII